MRTSRVLEPGTVRHRRWFVLAGAVALAGISAFATWWNTTLMGLPDIGDPFDVEAFTQQVVPDEENAYTLYRQAYGMKGKEPSDMTYDWLKAGPVEKAWLERNREALVLWKSGTDRSQSLYVPSRSMTLGTQLPVVQELRGFARLAQLEGSRLQAEGDLEGAWRCYRAIFRCSRHLCHHSTAIERLVGRALHQVACSNLTRWASDPRVEPRMLRQALDAAIDDYKATSPLSDNLKVEYLAFLHSYDDPALVRDYLNDEDVAGRASNPWFAREANVYSVAKGLKKEPERSRRVLRLIFANLLAVCDLPPDRRPPVACTLPGTIGFGPGEHIELYRLDASTPPLARALPPAKVREWFVSTLFASRLVPAFIQVFKAVDQERVTQANLVIALANRLYEIERGKPPQTYEELVGPYLKALPEGYKPLP